MHEQSETQSEALSPAQTLLKNEIRNEFGNEPLAKLKDIVSATELAELFVNSCFFRSVLQPLIDEEWLRNHSVNATSNFSQPTSATLARLVQMQHELQALDYLHDEIVEASNAQLKLYSRRTTTLLKSLVDFVHTQPNTWFRDFARHAMCFIDERARAQDQFAHNHFSEAMYRAFDQMDDVLGIRYELDRGMATDPEQKERLYEGAGIGVQTSYSSILLALDRAQVKHGARVFDLGSGYGRVGFVLGLLRPDIDFIGYEYVDHRVKDSQAVAARLGLERIEFVTQDLSAFKIPFADVYYMYDPFSRETYGFVLDQLIANGAHRPITIVTKGRANTWVREALETHGWLIDDTCDSGTVCLFRSRS